MYAAALLTVLTALVAMPTSAEPGDENYRLNVPFKHKEESPRRYPLKIQELYKMRHAIISPNRHVALYEEVDDDAHEQAIGTIIAAIDLTITLLNTLVNALGGVDRKIAVGISNEGTTVWNNPEVYFFSGTSDMVPPYEVKPGKAMTYTARKSAGPVARGVVGLIGYRMSDGNTLAVMFSVPFDYNLYENQWNARVYPGKVPIGYELYDDQYYLIHSYKGDNRWHEKHLGQGYHMRGAMNSAGGATLEIHITQK